MKNTFTSLLILIIMAPAVNAGIANSCNYCEHYHFQKAEVATFSESRSSNLVYTYHRLLINFESFRKLFHFVHYNLLPLRLFSELKTISITEQIHCATKTITSLFCRFMGCSRIWNDSIHHQPLECPNTNH